MSIHLKNVGSAPILKVSQFAVDGAKPFSTVINFLKKRLGGKPVFLYINSTFAPSPFATIKDLYQVLSELLS